MACSLRLFTKFMAASSLSTALGTVHKPSMARTMCRRVSPLTRLCSTDAHFRYDGLMNGSPTFRPLDGRQSTIRMFSTSPTWRQEPSRPGEEDFNTRKRKLPPLMEFPPIVWPKFSLVVRNWIKANFLVTPYFDRDFNIADFLAGAKKALVTVSKSVSEGKFEELQGLVHPRAVEEMKRNLSTMTLQERHLIAVDEEDIYLSFPYELGIILDDEENGKQERFVELTVVFHILKGLGHLREREDFQPSMNSIRDHKDKVLVANIRFIREFTKGVEDSWVINVLNIFRPSDELDE